jgi:hypothetical protein
MEAIPTTAMQFAHNQLRHIQSKLNLEDWNSDLYPLFSSKQVSVVLNMAIDF